MNNQTPNDQINNKEVEYLDVIYNTTKCKFKFWDRIKILFGKELTISTKIYTQNEQVNVVKSEASTQIAPFFVKKSDGSHDTLFTITH